MKKNAIVVAACLVGALLLAGCTTFKAEGLSFMPTDDSLQVVGTFEREVTVHEFLGTSGGANLGNITSDKTKSALTDAIWDEVQKAGGTGATNVEVEYKATFLNILCNGVTGSIWAPAKLVVSGTVVK